METFIFAFTGFITLNICRYNPCMNIHTQINPSFISLEGSRPSMHDTGIGKCPILAWVLIITLPVIFAPDLYGQSYIIKVSALCNQDE